MQIAGVFAVGGEQGHGIDAGAVVVELAFEALDLAAEDEVPVAAGAAVVAPAGEGGVVAKDGVQRGLRLVVVAEVFRPGVDLFLAGGVPRHLAAEGILLGIPVLGAFAHGGFELGGLGG